MVNHIQNVQNLYISCVDKIYIFSSQSEDMKQFHAKNFVIHKTHSFRFHYMALEMHNCIHQNDQRIRYF